MKTWLFALLESAIALIGLVAYFWADNIILATSAAMVAASLAVAKPLLSANKERKLEAYRDRQYEKSLETVDEQLNDLLKETIDPAVPHRATVVAVIHRRFPVEAALLIDQYDRTVHAISAGSAESETLAAQFADKVAPWSAGTYLQGLAALATGEVVDAHAHFLAATREQANWISPWLGWATAAYRQGLWNEIRENHPHLCGVELLPYGAGDENSFLKLTEAEREQLTSQFQQAATSLGNYYAIAEYCRSKEQIAVSQAEIKQVA
jgi:hypothetical protein